MRFRWILGAIFSFLFVFDMSIGMALEQLDNLPTSLHGTRAGKDFWYSADNGGFEGFTGITMEELGCKTCHGATDANGEPYPADYSGATCSDCHNSTDNTVVQEQCLSCHGRQATEATTLGYSDVHRDAGMVCWDCHSSDDLHGDGTEYASMLEPGAVDADCEDCHGGSGMPMPEGHDSYDPHGGKLHCAACHAQTVISCYNCHFESLVESHTKRSKQLLSDFVMLVNREKDGKVYPASFVSSTYDGTAFVAFGPFSPHTISAVGRSCPECHNTNGSNAAIDEYNHTRQIQFATWDDDTDTLSWIHGIVPIPEDYQTRLKMDFITYDGDPHDPAGPSTNWSSIGKDTWDGHQMLFATPLTRTQMDALGFATFEPAADVKVNDEDAFDIFTQTDQISVDVSLDPGNSDGSPADWWVVASTNWGWYYWDPLFGWQPGLYPSLVDFPAFDVDTYNVYDGTLYAGFYTFWFGVFTDDGAMAVDSVSTYVIP